MAEPVDQPMDAPFDETAPLEIPEHAAEEPEAADTGLHVAEPEDSPFVAPMERPVDEPAEDLYGDTAEWPVAAPADEPADEPVAEQSIAPAQRIENAAADQSLWASYTDEMPEVTEPPRMSPLFALVRVFALPRSTFRQVAEDDVTVWPAALALVALAALIKGGVALGFALRGSAPSAPLVAVAVRYAGELLFPAIFAAAFAGAMLLAQRLWAGHARFPELLSAASLALAPIALRDLLQAVYMVARQQVLVHPGLSSLVAPPDGSALGRMVYALLGGIDAFTLWAFVLLILAASVTGGRGRMRRAVAAILVTALCALVAAVPTLFIAGLLGG